MNSRYMSAGIAVAYCIICMWAIFDDASAQNFPAAFLATNSYEFQPVPEGTPIIHEFKIQNKGSAPLMIENVKTG